MNRLIFLDMDGVIVDLHKAVAQRMGITDLTAFNQGDLPVKDHELWGGTNAEWWADLSWMHDGREIVRLCEEIVGPENVIICSKPANWPGSAEGKLMWIAEHLPTYARRFILTPNKSWCACPRSLLIDDKEEFVDEFREASGAALLCPRAWNSLGQCNDVPAYLLSQIEEMVK